MPDEMVIPGSEGGTLSMMPPNGDTDREELAIGNGDAAEVTILTADVQPDALGLFTCPECLDDSSIEIPHTSKSRGGLGKHRKAAHGVEGQRRGTKQAKPRARRAQAKNVEFPAGKMLNLFFPDGMPADPKVMRNALDLIDEGAIFWNNTTKYRK